MKNTTITPYIGNGLGLLLRVGKSIWLIWVKVDESGNLQTPSFKQARTVDGSV